MTDAILKQLRVLIKKELTEYNTVSGLLSVNPDDENLKNANDRTFSICIGAKRRRFEQPALDSGLYLRYRMKIIEWQFKVIDHLDLDRDIVSISTNYLDRYCLKNPIPSGDLRTSQLLTLTCLYMAIKLFEFRAILARGAKTTMDTLLLMTGKSFTKQEMESMEYKILDTLKWLVHPPTEQIFLAHFMSVMPPSHSSKVEDLATYLMELALLDPFFAIYRKSETAFAALLYARGRILDNKESPFSLQLSESKYHNFDLQNPRIKRCFDRLSDLHRKSDREFFSHTRVPSPVSVMNPIYE